MTMVSLGVILVLKVSNMVYSPKSKLEVCYNTAPLSSKAYINSI